MHKHEDTDNPIMIRYENFVPKNDLASEFSHELRGHLKHLPGFISAVGYFKHKVFFEDCADYSAEIVIKSLTGPLHIQVHSSSLSQVMRVVTTKVADSVHDLQVAKEREGILHKGSTEEKSL